MEKLRHASKSNKEKLYQYLNLKKLKNLRFLFVTKNVWVSLRFGSQLHSTKSLMNFLSTCQNKIITPMLLQTCG